MFRIKNCHLCDKEMCRYNWDDYHYRHNNFYFCSWDCYRKWYKENRIMEESQAQNLSDKYAELADEVGMSDKWVKTMFERYGEVTIDDLYILKQNRGKWEKLLKGDK